MQMYKILTFMEMALYFMDKNLVTSSCSMSVYNYCMHKYLMKLLIQPSSLNFANLPDLHCSVLYLAIMCENFPKWPHYKHYKCNYVVYSIWLDSLLVYE